jgi:mRNA-degrading endonuclease toxin of MazEF toxin-antitoxin module
MKRGTIVWVDLSDTFPPEMGKVRPGIVISGTVHNEVLNTLVIIPTSTVPPAIQPLRMSVGSLGGKESYAVIPGIRQVRKGRLRGVIGQLSHENLSALDECLGAYLH